MEKPNSVIITKDEVVLANFTFDARGEKDGIKKAQVETLEWAIKRLQDELAALKQGR